MQSAELCRQKSLVSPVYYVAAGRFRPATKWLFCSLISGGNSLSAVFPQPTGTAGTGGSARCPASADPTVGYLTKGSACPLISRVPAAPEPLGTLPCRSTSPVPIVARPWTWPISMPARPAPALAAASRSQYREPRRLRPSTRRVRDGAASRLWVILLIVAACSVPVLAICGHPAARRSSRAQKRPAGPRA